jgi:hypothetical protein
MIAHFAKFHEFVSLRAGKIAPAASIIVPDTGLQLNAQR